MVIRCIEKNKAMKSDGVAHVCAEVGWLEKAQPRRCYLHTESSRPRESQCRDPKMWAWSRTNLVGME